MIDMMIALFSQETRKSSSLQLSNLDLMISERLLRIQTFYSAKANSNQRKLSLDSIKVV